MNLEFIKEWIAIEYIGMVFFFSFHSHLFVFGEFLTISKKNPLYWSYFYSFSIYLSEAFTTNHDHVLILPQYIGQVPRNILLNFTLCGKSKWSVPHSVWRCTLCVSFHTTNLANCCSILIEILRDKHKQRWKFP